MANLYFIFIKFVLFLEITKKFTRCEKLDLYSSSNYITSFDGFSLRKSLSNHSSMWLVEYYSSWCGTCHEFAPIYKSLAKDISGWRWLFNVGAINCDDTDADGTENSLTCKRDPFWVNGYPEFRLYPPNWQSSDLGKSIENLNSAKSIREEILPFIEEQLIHLDWKHLLPTPTLTSALYQDTINYLSSSEKSPNFVLIFEESTSLMGKEIILDMSSCPNILVRRVDVSTKDGEQLMDHFHVNQTSLPHVIVSTDHQTSTIHVQIKTRYFYVYQLERLPGVGDAQAKNNKKPVSVATSDLLKGNSIYQVDPDTIDWERTYLADIESALNYLLVVEIGANKVLEGSKLAAVKKLLSAFLQTDRFFPGSEKTFRFLQHLHQHLLTSKSVSYSSWESLLQSEDAPLSDRKWIGCSSRNPTLRGYPCGLWTTFHALSVACYRAQVKDRDLFQEAFKEIILNFFSCLECRKNFKNEINVVRFSDHSGPYASVIWLWHLHNAINARLHGNSTTEDPDHLKYQFPTDHSCPRCRYPDTNTAQMLWNETVVAEYLIARYAVENLFLNGTSSNEKSQEEYFEMKKNNINPRFRFSIRKKSLAASKFAPADTELNSFDINLCLFFWLASLLFAAYVYYNVVNRNIFSKKLSRRKVSF